MSRTKEKRTRTGLEIAVIGMAGRFPAAENIHKFWENLKNGIEAISFFSDEELIQEGIEPEVLKNSNYMKSRGALTDKEYFFDSSFFDYLPKEAAVMDPQIRIFHECSWEALEDAGYSTESYEGLIGVYAGLTPNLRWIFANLIQKGVAPEFFEALYLNSNFFSTLISYKLNLTGPAVTVQTSCSTSLAAIHMACRALLTGECHMALAGGVTLEIPQKTGYFYQEEMINSPDGHCRTFDARAKGTVGGSGIGIVVLKRLNAAITDRDEIYSVIKGSAINNDGKRKVGYTAPSVEGQVEVIRAALQIAEVEPESIGYIEAHGTGTSLGDPVEIEALKQAFNTKKRGFCGIGSVKTNLGHLDSAAGVAGFIKTVLALKHRLIPASLHFETPNPKFAFENSPFYVNAALRPWENNGYPLRAGVSSFGIGGTNVHVVLEQAPVIGHSSLVIGDKRKEREYQLILLSAKTQSALDKMTENLAEYFKKNLLNHANHKNPTNPGLTLADAAYTLQVGRKAFNHRRMLVCSTNDVDKAIEVLLSPGSGEIHNYLDEGENRPVVFMFPGQGSQYMNMALDLYKTEPVFHEAMDRCFEFLKPLMGYDLKEILYPTHPAPPGHSSQEGNVDGQTAASTEKINRTEITQPVLFVIEYALAKLLMKWGIKPYAMIGHSIGEYVAACLSGVFSIEDALRLVTLRGKLMQQISGGSMVSVPLPGEKLTPILNKQLSLAAVNSSWLCVVSGPDDAIHAFELEMKDRGYNTRRLHTSHAFHSSMMDPIVEKFKEQVKQIQLNKPEIPYISNVTGQWIAVQEAMDPKYWAKQLRSTVQFSHGLKELLKEEHSILIEVGPGKVLSTFVRQHQDKKQDQLVVNLVKHPEENVEGHHYLLNRIGKLWLYGKKIEWQEFYSDQKRYRVPLPTYPFEKQCYQKQVESLRKGFKLFSGLLRSTNISGKSVEPPGLFDVPSWKPSMLNINTEINTNAQDSEEVNSQAYHNRTGLSHAYVVPQNEIEQELTKIFRDFFGIRHVGVYDDFFELGGDSLKAMTLTSIIQKVFNLKIPLPEMFKAPTIRGLFKYMKEAKKYQYESIEAVEKKEYYNLSSAQKRLYIIHRMDSKSTSTSYNISKVVILEGKLDLEKLEGTFKNLVKRHNSCRTSFELLNGQPVQRIHHDIEFLIEYVDAGKASPGEIDEKVKKFIQPFDISQPPLLRIGLIKTEKKRCILMVDIHHIVSDFISNNILIRDFFALYRGEELPTLRLQYKDYSEWQDDWHTLEEIKRQENYWLKVFEGKIPVLNIPANYPRPPIQGFEGEDIRFIIDSPLCQGLNRLIKETGTTLYMFLLAVCNVLLWKYTGQEDIVIGSPVMGRRHVDLQNIVGMFVGQLPMRNRPSAYKTFREFLNEVKENALEAYENQEYPFEELTRKLGLQGNASRHPLFDVVFAVFYKNGEENGDFLEGEGIYDLKFRPYPYEDRTSKTDLRFAATETGDNIIMTLTYSTALFKQSTCDIMAKRFIEIVKQVLKNSHIRLADITVSLGISSASSHLLQDKQGDFNF